MGCVSIFLFSKRVPLKTELLVKIVCRLPGFSNKRSKSERLSLFFLHLHCSLSPMYAYIYIYTYTHINLGITLTWTSSGAWSAVKVILRCDPKGPETLCFSHPSFFPPLNPFCSKLFLAKQRDFSPVDFVECSCFFSGYHVLQKDSRRGWQENSKVSKYLECSRKEFCSQQ